MKGLKKEGFLMKKSFIIMLLVSAIIITGCGTKNEGVKEETKTEYFDFTVTDFVDTLSEEYFTHLTLISTVPVDDGIKINSYTCGTLGYSPLVHYQISYDEKTEKVTHISFFLDKDFETDLSDLVLAHYFIHVQTVSSVIEPDIDNEALLDEIVTGFAEKKLNTSAALCERKKFTLYAFNSDSYFDASFQPIRNTKGD